MHDLADMTMELWVAGIAQTIMLTLVGIAFVTILLHQKNNTLYRLMLLLSMGTLLQNAGYLQELRSSTTQEAMAGIRIEYIGGAFMATLFLGLILLYCGYQIPKKLFTVLIALDILVVLSVWTSEFNPMYYTSLDFDPDAAIPHLVLGKGWLYLVSAVATFAQLLACLAITIYTAIKTKDKKQRKGFNLIILSCIFPVISYFIGAVTLFNSLDPVPMGVGAGMISLSIAILFHHAFDLVASAHDTIIQDLDEAVLIVDLNNTLADINAKAHFMFPSLANYRQKGWKPDDQIKSIFQAKQDSEFDLNDQIYRIHRNEIIIDQTLSGYVYTLYDITDERRQLQNMQRLKEDADRANQAKSHFLAHVSHEVRTPINAVLGMDEMILRGSEEPETLRYARDIKTAARTLLSIINDILDSSKLESGKMELVPVEYETKTLLTDVYNMIIVKATDKQLKLQFEIDPSLPSALLGDDIRIRQVMLNLLSNAVKYTDKGTVTLRATRVSDPSDTNSATVKYEVIDSGIGIREEDLPHLCEAFERVDLEHNRNIEGTGLGMSIVVNFLRLMGSTLHVESTYGEGSNFYFKLTAPIISPEFLGDFEQIQPLVETAAAYEVSFIAPNAKVLVVDDNKTNRDVFKGLLRETEVQITEADSGAACLELVQNERFDIIFMDDMMPGMSGREALKEMQKMENNLCADIPVIMLTANAIHGEKEKYLALGFHDFLIKPIDPEQLESMLGRSLPATLVRWSVAELDHRENLSDNEESNLDVDPGIALLSDIEGMDLNYAKLHLPSDTLILQTARSFCESIPQELELLQQLIDCISEEAYLTDYRIRVHTIKSSAATIGITALSGIASLSEAAARAEDLDRVALLHPVLAEQLGIYHDRLHVLIDAAENVGSPKEPADMKEILPLLEQLCVALKDRDYDAADLLSEKLGNYSYPDDLQDQIKLLQSQVMNLDADNACATAEQIIRQH